LPEVICNASPLQYLHQLGALLLLPALVKNIIVPPSVELELNAGFELGLSLPNVQSLDWVTVRRPNSSVALPMITDLGAGEREVLALALETPDSVCILDDALARQVAKILQLRVTGTLGILLDAKQAKIIPAVRPLLDQLDTLGFRLAAHTRTAVLSLAGESTP
jgi:predicted nucleic acid-binding protein